MNPLLEKAKNIRALIIDIDGVLTDGYLNYNADGVASLRFHIRDGLGLVLLQNSGVPVAVITTANRDIIDKRLSDLNIQHYYKAYRNKILAFEKLREKLNLEPEQFAYIGDDLPDIAVMQQVGFSIAVGDANNAVREIADWTTEANGGAGAVREACDLIMQAQGTLETALTRFKTDAYEK